MCERFGCAFFAHFSHRRRSRSLLSFVEHRRKKNMVLFEYCYLKNWTQIAKFIAIGTAVLSVYLDSFLLSILLVECVCLNVVIRNQCVVGSLLLNTTTEYTIYTIDSYRVFLHLVNMYAVENEHMKFTFELSYSLLFIRIRSFSFPHLTRSLSVADSLLSLSLPLSLWTFTQNGTHRSLFLYATIGEVRWKSNSKSRQIIRQSDEWNTG